MDPDRRAGFRPQRASQLARLGAGRPLPPPEEAERLDLVAACKVGAFCGVKIHAGIEQEDCHVLGAVAEDLEVDVGMLAGGAVEYRASQVWVVGLEAFHQDQRDAAQQREHAGL